MTEPKTKDWQSVIDNTAKEEIAKATPANAPKNETGETSALQNELEKVRKDLLGTGGNDALLFLEHPAYQKLEDMLTEAEKRTDEYKGKYLRLIADVDNMRRRAEKDIANAHSYALENFLTKLLPIIDSLERSLITKTAVNPADNEILNNMHLGIELTLKMFLEVLEKHGVTQLDPIGQSFNPDQHTAMLTREDANAKPNTVLEVMQKGYILKGRLLRPAMVVVAK
jgi:molecular chaperone GrpE